ncbi:aggregation-promoting factor C-terminal-like domain-containing protein [Puerhibacterium puerhi]|uniref:aggregation-promoting factor C-terminal-like domain-containing protein n=1 Tax=Puerhibacterium puerhi TaxID=2692623 RepID=UPI001F1B441E|nr:G5 domain-containing protein [Puerhibacterium puerhi]
MTDFTKTTAEPDDLATAQIPAVADPAAAPPTDTTRKARAAGRRRRRWPLVAGLTAGALAVSGGAVAYGNAQKTVTLDVDGKVTTVSTFAGSVEGVLDAQGVRVGDRDVVAPAAGSPLREGADIVVRYGRQVTLQTDGKQSDVWVTALDADEALAGLQHRGGDVALVASRSGDRADLGLRLDAEGPVAVVADGKTRVAPDGSVGLQGVLEAARVTIDGDDRVRVVEAGDAGVDTSKADAPSVAVVVQRVETKDVTTKTAIPFETQKKKDGNLYTGETKVGQEGAEGERTLVERVTTVDGKEESRTKVSEKITKEPTAKVVLEGTKERPKPKPAAPSSSSSSSSAGSTTSGGASSGSSSSGPSMSGSPRAIGQQLAAARGWTGSQWTCLENLFDKESGWNPSASNPSSGAYGIPQALPGSKMGSVASDWRTNPVTQITWGLDYIAGRYGTPCGAWGHSESNGWY